MPPKYSQLIGRILLSGIFIQSAIRKIINSDGTIKFMAQYNLPGFLLIPTIIVLLVGGVSILIGYKARIGAWLLIGFLIPATLIFHTDFTDFDEKISFFKNLGLIGGLLFITSFGAGSLSLDRESS